MAGSRKERSLELADALEEIKAGKARPIYLVVGDEFLARRAADDLASALLPRREPGINLITLDAAAPRELVHELSTGSMFSPRKVVLVRDPEFLMPPRKGRVDGLTRARDAWKANRKREGARRLLGLLGAAGLDVGALRVVSEAAAARLSEALGVTLETADRNFLDEVHGYCRSEGLEVTAADDAALLELYRRGAPPEHFLLLVAEAIEARNPLVAWVREHGALLERKVAAKLKDLDLGGAGGRCPGTAGRSRGARSPGASEGALRRQYAGAAVGA